MSLFGLRPVGSTFPGGLADSDSVVINTPYFMFCDAMALARFLFLFDRQAALQETPISN